MSSARSGGSLSVAQRSTSWQEKLDGYCSRNFRREPSYNIVSDRRGKRTAWSCTVSIPSGQTAPALYWYDGQYVNGAKEDAAEQACRLLGIEPTTNGHTSSKSNGGSSMNLYSKGRVEGWGTR